jgi:ribosome-associated protein
LKSKNVKPLAKEDNLLNSLIVDAIQDIKGKNIIKLDLRKIGDAPTDFFIICEGDSSTQVRAIAQNVSKKVALELGMQPAKIEGANSATWVLVDYFNTVVHVFYPETREFYDIEDLWSDADALVYENL